MTGKFVWYELMTTDTKAAEAFYCNVVGWGAHDSGMPGMDYTIVMAGETGVGGIMKLPPGAPQPGWMGYISCDDVDAAAGRVTKAGGAIHREPQDIPGVGRFAVAADPQGAVFTLFKPSAEMSNPPKPADNMGQGGWHELSAKDWESAFAFYADQFGWTKDRAVDMGAMGTYQLFAVDGLAVGGMMTNRAVPAPSWLYYFTVPDINAAVARITAAGGQVLHGPMEVPGGSQIVQGRDPQGGMFALVQPAA